MRAALACLLAACGGPRYLGTPVPSACSSGDPERCAGWMAERDLGDGELDVYDDADLRGYVQGIADRLARGARLAHAPRVVIADHDGTYAAFGDRIVIGRMAIERLGTEAELAGIVAHELVHVEGHHAIVSLFGPDADAAWLAARRDAEAIADERAVALLQLAGYAPTAMSRALTAELDDDDDEHPPRADRIAHVTTLAGGATGFEGRAELLRHVENMVVGRDTRLGQRVGTAWIVATLGVALELPARDVAHIDGDDLVLRRGHSAMTVYPIGAPWARELASQLDDRAEADSALGRITVGRTPLHEVVADQPLAKLEREVRATLPRPEPGSWVVILDRPRGGLILELSARSDPFVRDRWLGGLRAASDAEITSVEPPRIAITRASRSGTVRELAADCPDPELATRLDDAERLLAAGEPFKCTDR